MHEWSGGAQKNQSASQKYMQLNAAIVNYAAKYTAINHIKTFMVQVVGSTYSLLVNCTLLTKEGNIS